MAASRAARYAWRRTAAAHRARRGRAWSPRCRRVSPALRSRRRVSRCLHSCRAPGLRPGSRRYRDAVVPERTPAMPRWNSLTLRELTVDDIRVRLAGVDDFERLGVERSYFLTSIEFDDPGRRATGGSVIRLIDARGGPRALPGPDHRGALAHGPRAARVHGARGSAGLPHRERSPCRPRERVRDRVEPASPPWPEAPAEPGRRAGVTAWRCARATLPPGEMPERAFSAQTASTPAPAAATWSGATRPCGRSPARGKPEGVSVQQAMLDIQRLNPEAFIDGNINRIKAGYIIYLPACRRDQLRRSGGGAR
jgi:hypothetical protein